MARIDEEGYIFICGRKKNVIVLKNGKNVYPEELEQLIANLPYVEENMVYGKEKDDDLVVSVKIVYNEDYVKENFKDFSQAELKEKIWEDIKEINKGLTNYKHMIRKTTQKIKKYEEIKKEKI